MTAFDWLIIIVGYGAILLGACAMLVVGQHDE